MPVSKKKIATIVAGLCILCCAAPIAALVVGGAGLAALSPEISEIGGELQYLSLGLGLAAVAFGIYLFWQRSKKGAHCDVD